MCEVANKIFDKVWHHEACLRQQHKINRCVKGALICLLINSALNTLSNKALVDEVAKLNEELEELKKTKGE